MVQTPTSVSVQTKVLLVSAAALATGLAAYALGYYDYDWRLAQTQPTQQQDMTGQTMQQDVQTQQPLKEVGATLLSNPVLPDAIVGQPYETRLSASTAENTRWSLEQGALPPGLTLDEARGVISGVANSPGPSLFRLRFGNNELTGVSQFTLNVVSGEGMSAATTNQSGKAQITTATLPSGRVGETYSVPLVATGDIATARSWRLSTNTAPGIILNGNGELVGRPSQTGTFLVSVVLTTRDADQPTLPYEIQRQYPLVILEATTTEKPETPEVKPEVKQEETKPESKPEEVKTEVKAEVKTDSGIEALTISGGYPDGGIGGYYSSSPLQASGGQSPYTWSLLGGNVPSGLYFSSNSQIAGYANQYGVFTFTVQVQDQAGRVARVDRTISIRPAQPVVSASADPDLSNRLRRIDLMGVQIHDLIKLQDDGNPDTQYDTTVYYVGADGRRHSFPNPKVYFTWFPDFSRVRIVAPRELSDIPLGANLTYRPGTRLVKFTTDPRVYAVDSDRRLRWVKTESAAEGLYGPFWARQVDDISDAFYMDYKFGQDIDRAGDYSVTGARSTANFPSDVLPR